MGDGKCTSSIRTKIQEYFTLNMNTVSSIQTVWEAFKATCRRWIISYSTAKKREKNERKNSLKEELNKVEKRHMREPDNHMLRDRVLLCRAQLHEMMLKKLYLHYFNLKGNIWSQAIRHVRC